jgi:hypothetical protein
VYSKHALQLFEAMSRSPIDRVIGPFIDDKLGQRAMAWQHASAYSTLVPTRALHLTPLATLLAQMFANAAESAPKQPTHDARRPTWYSRCRNTCRVKQHRSSRTNHEVESILSLNRGNQSKNQPPAGNASRGSKCSQCCRVLDLFRYCPTTVSL